MRVENVTSPVGNRKYSKLSSHPRKAACLLVIIRHRVAYVRPAESGPNPITYVLPYIRAYVLRQVVFRTGSSFERYVNMETANSDFRKDFSPGRSNGSDEHTSLQKCSSRKLTRKRKSVSQRGEITANP